MCSMFNGGTISQKMFNSRLVGLRSDFPQIQFPRRHWVLLNHQRNDIYWGPAGACCLCCCTKVQSGEPGRSSPWLSSPSPSSWDWYFLIPVLTGRCPCQSLQQQQLLDLPLFSSCFYGSPDLAWIWLGYPGCLHIFLFSPETQTWSGHWAVSTWLPSRLTDPCSEV